MMTQADLLERAKQGNPDAIAALMNLVLEPRGVSAQASLQNRCLHVFFTSDQLLSQATLANFVRTGLSTIASKSIQTVKLYARKVGQNSPIWVEEFSLNAAIQTPAPSPMPVPAPAGDPAAIAAPPPPPPSTTAPLTLDMASLRAIAHSLNPSRPAPPPTAMSAQGAVMAPPTAPPMAPMPQPPLPPAPPAKSQSAKSLRKRSKRTAVPPGRKVSKSPRRRRRVSKPLVLASMIGAGAFLIGGVLAVSFKFPFRNQSQAASQAGASNASALTVASSNNSLVPATESSKEALELKAKQYMAQMNQAQQAFYETNKRFAENLEELERSASVISQSSHYTYRLVMRHPGQAVLTATPKEEGFKSFSGAIFLAETAQGSDSVAGLLCETTRPSKYPPVLPQEAGAVIQCPADAVNVPY